MEAQPRQILNYRTIEGKSPFLEWRDSLRDSKAKAKITSRIDRVAKGNLGDYRSVGEGVCELRIDYGPGYRIYFGQIGLTIVIILCGGDKSYQEKDIREAIEYWRDYNNRSNEDD
ncbi:type II toxin-antitoxin system RelE/ParE family toxin [Floridanema aerugineum]|uniref:Type II toxin-antitoxin system RelE/ParE family toxin n=1 Tax=Floridaenema aerugineum BLCC-F46 TaxID=3153654 RepID=A0ABV4X2T5_9CYAN